MENQKKTEKKIMEIEKILEYFSLLFIRIIIKPYDVRQDNGHDI